MSAKRHLYRHDELKRLIEPQSIAIIGASATSSSFGARTRKSLEHFKGPTMLVNPRHEAIDEHPCYPTVASLPVVPDCVIVATPSNQVERVLVECGEAKVGGAVIYASGFAETRKAGAVTHQERISAIARETGVRVIGPNCIGIANFLTDAIMMFYPAPRPTFSAKRRVGLISQTGALGLAIAQSIETGTGLSHLLTSGNSCDVDVADLIAYLAEDPACDSVACLFEGLTDATRLLEAGDIVRQRGKVLAIHKIASGKAGAKAAQSHTGTIAGSDRVYRAAFSSMGAVVVSEPEGLLEAANYLAKFGRLPRAPGVAVISGSGGAAVMAADKAERHAVPLPQPTEDMLATLREILPDFAAVGNPCDVTAQVTNNSELFCASAEVFMSADEYGTLVIPSSFASTDAVKRIGDLSEVAARHGKGVCYVALSHWWDGPGNREIEMNPGVALFRSMDRCFAAISATDQRVKAKSGEATRRISPVYAEALARKVIAEAKHGALGELEALRILDAYEIPVVASGFAVGVSEAIEQASRICYPVVLKVASPDLPHKSEAGAVVLNIKSESELRAAYDRALQAAKRFLPRCRIDGVLIQPMLKGDLELLLGTQKDVHFGPIVVAGLGGVFVESLDDVQIALAPTTMSAGMEMLKALKGHRLFEGYRGMAKIDTRAIADVLCRLSELAVDLADVVESIEINPLLCTGAQVTALDGLVVRQDSGEGASRGLCASRTPH